jgi:hypothetical protein
MHGELNYHFISFFLEFQGQENFVKTKGVSRPMFDRYADWLGIGLQFMRLITTFLFLIFSFALLSAKLFTTPFVLSDFDSLFSKWLFQITILLS